MSTLLQLVNETLRRTGQLEATTLTNAQTPTIQTLDFLNETYFEMLQRLKVSKLVQSANFTTSNGVTSYSVASEADVNSVLSDSLREAITSSRLKEVAYTYPVEHGENSSGKPEYFYRSGTQLHLYPVPDGAYTFDYHYQIKPQTLSGDATTTALPEEWEKVLILGTQARLEKFLGEGGGETYLLYRDGLTQLKSLAPLKPAYRMKGFYRGGRSV